MTFLRPFIVFNKSDLLESYKSQRGVRAFGVRSDTSALLCGTGA